MTEEEQRKAVDEWVKGRKWVKCVKCDLPLTVGQDPFTMFARGEHPRVKVEVECFPCQGRNEDGSDADA